MIPFLFRNKLIIIGWCVLAAACNTTTKQPVAATAYNMATTAVVETSDSLLKPPQYDANGHLLKVEKSPEQWKAQLSSEAYRVLREEGTDRPFTGNLWNNHEKGTFICSGCGLPLFRSETKFESGTGWPSFYQPMTKDCIARHTDRSYGMERTEVECARCGGHQGHVFEDGPAPTGLRYCINTASLNFIPDK